MGIPKLAHHGGYCTASRASGDRDVIPWPRLLQLGAENRPTPWGQAHARTIPLSTGTGSRMDRFPESRDRLRSNPALRPGPGEEGATTPKGWPRIVSNLGRVRQQAPERTASRIPWHWLITELRPSARAPPIRHFQVRGWSRRTALATFQSLACLSDYRESMSGPSRRVASPSSAGGLWR